jgi:hypothetical protein
MRHVLVFLLVVSITLAGCARVSERAIEHQFDPRYEDYIARGESLARELEVGGATCEHMHLGEIPVHICPDRRGPEGAYVAYAHCGKELLGDAYYLKVRPHEAPDLSRMVIVGYREGQSVRSVPGKFPAVRRITERGKSEEEAKVLRLMVYVNTARGMQLAADVVDPDRCMEADKIKFD